MIMAPLRTFFDPRRVQVLKKAAAAGEGDEQEEDRKAAPKTTKEEPIWKSLESEPDLRLSSLDLVVYSYLKEELINSEGTPEAKYLTEKCPRLLSFYKLMEFLFEEGNDSDEGANDARENFFKVNKVCFVEGSGRGDAQFDFSEHL